MKSKRSTRRWSWILLPLGALLASAAPAWGQDARQIMRWVEAVENGQTQLSRQKVATCRYRIKSRRIVCAEQPRVKETIAVRMDYGIDGKDTRSVMFLLEPPGERGIGFLQYDYHDPGRATEQWMYLPALGKVRRLITGDADQPNSGSLFGSELSYEDLERPHLEDFVFTLEKTGTFAGRPCWVIARRPTPRHAAKSSYSKALLWVDRERLLVLKTQLYDRRGRPLKQITVNEVRRIEKIWVVMRMTVNNVQTRRITTLKWRDVALNVPVDGAFFAPRILTDAAFREAGIKRMRTHLR
ncbi:MAG: outer membrane lipoprotein-sorting protein [bacterium]